ncbi:hypothetical protein Pst134EA_005408 [Puccinia striiformis f. sp. tritici]|uniref:Uncharacterized protein n=1 Tax=Puccinia striiformis f. sp. tritici PST-78 TaxID=1165861 RepID=A0A0L0V2G0_9BASI|nr:hypothetical protein Pst134EA_005408 [Puccinia striiformis f. sp. tritici]KAH9471513.1 hypothetical protein Pst134EA_005408 [Puccinia striiformis f. sp. tritici]KAI9627836.1 hypothetical protein H4Q26_017157 [Puccinia striiformis f. sp. tritici PST-130]KNE93462.1 hypothetical protein PSTG_13185 [Puccinia striiformis f. sp. tritici PST-78]
MDYLTHTRLSFFLLLIAISLGKLQAATPHASDKPSQASPAGGPITFRSPLAKAFVVPQSLPGVGFPIQQSYAGRLNIATDPKQTAEAFFWMIPADNARGSKHVTMWINGYDVCSSLYGAFRGSGPITMSLEGGKPVKNPYSWTRSSNVIYLDVLPKVGFTRGTYSVNSSRDVGVLVFSFLKSFLKVFPEMNGLNLFLAGNYYTGTYANYAAQKIYAQQSQLGLKLQGMILVDALIAASDFHMYAATTKFVTENNDVFKFDAAKLQKLLATDKQCGFSEYLKKFLTYPPSGHFPEITKALDPSNPPWFTPDCMNLYSQMYMGAPRDLNLWNIHDKPGSADTNYTRFNYPGRPDVQKAFNLADVQPWSFCNQVQNVFPNDDGSGLATDILPDVIQRSKKVVIMHAELDATLPVEGMRLALQNVTWAGKQGFQKPLTTNLIVAGKQSGKYQSERGLTFVQVAKSGAMIAHDQGEVALTVLDYLLGNRPAL